LCGKRLDANEVTVYDNLTRDSLKDKSFRDHANPSIIAGDILDTDALSRACAKAKKD
jgi:UDP-glucose 4-epimerase